MLRHFFLFVGAMVLMAILGGCGTPKHTPDDTVKLFFDGISQKSTETLSNISTSQVVRKVLEIKYNSYSIKKTTSKGDSTIVDVSLITTGDPGIEHETSVWFILKKQPDGSWKIVDVGTW